MKPTVAPTRTRTSFIFALAVFTASLWVIAPAFCQDVINVPPDPAPTSVGSNTTLNLLDGGLIDVDGQFSIGANDGTSENVEVNIEGGEFIVGGFGILANAGSIVNIRGGEVFGSFRATGGSRVSIEGGLIGPGGFFGGLLVEYGSSVSVSGGVLQTTVRSAIGGSLIISGGSIGNIESRDDGEIRMSGGATGSVNGLNGSSILVSGGDYRVNGILIPNLVDVGSSVQYHIRVGATLTGVLQDGSPFAFIESIDTFIAAGVLTLETVSIPPVGPTLIRASTDPVPHGIRNGQTLIVDDGAVVPERFTALTGSTVNIEPGGIMGPDFEAFEAVVNMSGGSAGGGFTVIDSELNISGGRILLADLYGSKLVMSGGEIAVSLDLAFGSEAIITGGSLIGGVDIREQSTTHISGGDLLSAVLRVGDSAVVYISGGSLSTRGSRIFGGLHAEPGGTVHLRGTQFQINDIDVDGLLPGQAFTIIDRDVTLTGILSDGSPFSFPLSVNPLRGGVTFPRDAILTVTLVPEPTSSAHFLVCLALGTIVRRQRIVKKATQLEAEQSASERRAA